jgi:uncharacterized protein YggE
MKTVLSILSLIWLGIATGQIGGNQLYGGNSNQYQNIKEYAETSAPKVTMTQESVKMFVNILSNVKADAYVVTLGINEENLSVESCNAKINQRIENFKNSISKLGIKSSDVYVDFVAQTKIYDYVSDEGNININIKQVDVGFEIKKNIIFKISKLEIFDEIVELASREKIYNIINVEYYVENENAIYEEMLEEAMKIQKARLKLLNLKESDWEMKPMMDIQFISIQPGKQYKKFQAYESGTVSYSNHYNNNTIVVQKEQRKSSTFYFDGLDSNVYDKIMNATTPIVGLQYSMNVTFVFTKKNQKVEEKIYYVITPNGEMKQVKL